jgi:hypothetical protein
LRLLGSGEKPARKYKCGHTSGDRVFAGDSQFTPPARKSACGTMDARRILDVTRL